MAPFDPHDPALPISKDEWLEELAVGGGWERKARPRRRGCARRCSRRAGPRDRGGEGGGRIGWGLEGMKEE